MSYNMNIIKTEIDGISRKCHSRAGNAEMVRLFEKGNRLFIIMINGGFYVNYFLFWKVELFPGFFANSFHHTVVQIHTIKESYMRNLVKVGLLDFGSSRVCTSAHT